MSYAIISVGGKQYRVREGERLLVDRLPLEDGATFTPSVLLTGGDGETTLAPGVVVTAKVVRQTKGPKLTIGKYKKRYEEERAKVAANPQYEIPERSSNCEPPGMPTMMTMPYSLEFLFTPGKIVVNQEAEMMVRHIFTDGRPLPTEDEIDPNYFGYSVGHWEGDTLVVDTVGTRAGQRLGEQGITNSEKLRINERIYLDKDNKNLLHLDFTFTDPEVLAQPWHRTHTFRRDRTWEILEYVCDENDRHPVDANGQTHAQF